MSDWTDDDELRFRSRWRYRRSRRNLASGCPRHFRQGMNSRSRIAHDPPVELHVFGVIRSLPDQFQQRS